MSAFFGFGPVAALYGASSAYLAARQRQKGAAFQAQLAAVQSRLFGGAQPVAAACTYCGNTFQQQPDSCPGCGARDFERREP